MSDVVIRVENLSKNYQFGTINHGTLSHDLQGWWARLRGKEDPNLKVEMPNLHQPGQAGERFWALQDVSFDIRQGELVGIIGRNGAGKSTLLKVLSKITAPTSGCAKLKGRVGSLLEVGTGFHRELTGRENIFLNGAILGMSKTEIRKKFDEIVDFSGIERFIDTPVKRYSSGMHVRLAFAVAAHLEPEILIIDEVLAVGDIAFQKKCLGKMENVAQGGRTVLFVSHNLQAVRTLCKRGILLEQGRLELDAPVVETTVAYQERLRQDAEKITNRKGLGEARFTEIRVENEKGKVPQAFEMGETVRFVLSFEVFKAVDVLVLVVQIASGRTNEVLTSARYTLEVEKVLPGYKETVVLECPKLNLRPGEYGLNFILGSMSRGYDVVLNGTAPLIVRTDKELEELGFSPSVFSGYYNIDSRIIREA